MVARDSETADKLMAMYLNAPNATTTKYGSKTGGFSSKPKKGRKNKGGKKQPQQQRAQPSGGGGTDGFDGVDSA